MLPHVRIHSRICRFSFTEDFVRTWLLSVVKVTMFFFSYSLLLFGWDFHQRLFILSSSCVQAAGATLTTDFLTDCFSVQLFSVQASERRYNCPLMCTV